MTIAREEIFGPVITAIPFRDEAEAIALANDSDYGLYGYVWTGDVARGLRVSRARSAPARCRSTAARCNPDAPFGGYKQSRHRPRRRPLGARGVQRAQVHRVDGMSFDTIIKGGTVVDGSGLPEADRRRRHPRRHDHRHRAALGRAGARSTPTAWSSCPASSTPTRTTTRSSRSSRSRRRRASTASRRWSAATAATRSRRCKPADHDWVTKLFAKVEGMTPSVLERGAAVGLGQLPVVPRRARQAARHQRRDLRRPLGAAPLRHGRGRVGARRRRADEVEHDAEPRARGDARRRRRLLVVARADARRPPTAGRCRRGTPTSTRCWRSRRRRARAARARSRSSPRPPCRATTPTTASGSSSWRTPRACRSSCRAWATGPGARRGGTTRRAFLADARARRARRSTRCCARSRSCGRSTGSAARRSSTACSTGATLQRIVARAAARPPAGPGGARAKLRWGLDHPNTDPEKGSTLPPPAMTALFVDRSTSDPGAVGQEPRAAREGARRPSRPTSCASSARRRRPRDAVPVEQRDAGLDRGQRRVAAEPAHDRRHRRRRRARRPRRRRRVVDVLPPLVAPRPRST